MELTLLRALHAAGMVTDSNSTDPNKLKWTRSSRTDKGVHSLALARDPPAATRG